MSGWETMESAPKDGTQILAWCVHRNAAYCKDPVGEHWAAPVIAYWTEHNHGGWVWNGMVGQFTHWMRLPSAPPGAPL